ncbi:hypothetical protein [Lentzea flaviverrucosa]|uniref:hypothetical protein n=1 Tax=Lentzea flaviverrucosa TaxID=200379 RepID=UPI0011607F96|nr:hypothetical protein [Lentzea flaviverrucosa]
MVVLSSPVVSTTVAEVSAYHVYLVWPWKTKDPESQFAWNGTVAFSRDSESPEWLNTPWRFGSDPSDLKTGDTVELSIPEFEATVLSVKKHEPARDAGWLPRPTLTLGLCATEFVDDPEAGFVIYCDTEEPISMFVADRG